MPHQRALRRPGPAAACQQHRRAGIRETARTCLLSSQRHLDGKTVENMGHGGGFREVRLYLPNPYGQAVRVGIMSARLAARACASASRWKTPRAK
jgi:hypothetical protein